MSNIFAAYTRSVDGGDLPVSSDAQDHENMHLWIDATSYINVVVDGVVDHYGAGLPFDADGNMVVGSDAVDYRSQGVPFTAAGRVAVASGARAYHDQGVWFTASGHVSGIGTGVAPQQPPVWDVPGIPDRTDAEATLPQEYNVSGYVTSPPGSGPLRDWQIVPPVTGFYIDDAGTITVLPQ
jgi:hypothetical protein